MVGSQQLGELLTIELTQNCNDSSEIRSGRRESTGASQAMSASSQVLLHLNRPALGPLLQTLLHPKKATSINVTKTARTARHDVLLFCSTAADTVCEHLEKRPAKPVYCSSALSACFNGLGKVVAAVQVNVDGEDGLTELSKWFRPPWHSPESCGQ